MPKKVLIALPPAMLEQIDFIATAEHRTRSDLIREALRRYSENFRRNQDIPTIPRTEPAQPRPLNGTEVFGQYPAKTPSLLG